MKLSKKSAARQRAIHKALAAGKALGGLLAGFAASVVSGCGEHSPTCTMGDYPAPNAVRESRNRAAVRGKMLLTPPRQKSTNALNETKGVVVTDGEVPPPSSKSTNAVDRAKKPDGAGGVP